MTKHCDSCAKDGQPEVPAITAKKTLCVGEGHVRRRGLVAGQSRAECPQKVTDVSVADARRAGMAGSRGTENVNSHRKNSLRHLGRPGQGGNVPLDTFLEVAENLIAGRSSAASRHFWST